MIYIKVNWKHGSKEYPTILYSDLGDDRYELRKVEEFYDGTFSYAGFGKSLGLTVLGEIAVPLLQDINSDPQFEAIEITREDFDKVWKKAVVS